MKKKSRNIRSESGFEKRLATYGMMSVALAAIAVPQTAKAGAVEWTAGITTTPDLPAIYFTMNLPDATIGTAYLGSSLVSPEADTFKLWMNKSNAITEARFSVNSNRSLFFVASNSAVARMSQSAKIGPGLGLSFLPKLSFRSSLNTSVFVSNLNTLAGNGFAQSGNWKSNGNPGVVGFEVVQSGNTYYGWADISVDPTTYEITLNSYGVDTTPNETVTANTGATPEPSSIVLLTLGAAGIAAWRRKIKTA
jgi:hypothetical protein